MKLPIDMPKQFNSLLILLLIFTIQISHTNPCAQSAPTSYSLVTYNVENLFDADGVAVYSDYLNRPQGNSQFNCRRIQKLAI